MSAFQKNRVRSLWAAIQFIIIGSCIIACKRTGSDPVEPNIILILTDDQGWGDVGFNGSTDIHTPHLDALAASGVIFSQGYVSHPYCSPSRAGLLTGRYQQHFGHENNPGYPEFEDEVPDGLPLDEILLSDVLKSSGYRTAAVGKWHLGDDQEFWPTERGFDEWFGFSGGGMNYWGQTSNPIRGVLHNGVPVPLEQLTYLTDDFSDASVDFIRRNSQHPFFLYLAYNAPHAPIQATTEYTAQTEYIEYGPRSAYAAMIAGIDKGVGKIRAVLEEVGIKENTLMVFLSDNGGHNIGSSCGPYRGWKGMLYEGGIRVPFCLSWPARIDPDQLFLDPITSLDIFPTIIDAAGITQGNERDFPETDGISLLPFLNGNSGKLPHESLFWRYSDGAGYAVRHGKYKLVSQYLKPLSLFDMDADPYEQNSLAEGRPEIVSELQELYKQWDEKNMGSLWEDPHLENVEKQENERLRVIRRASAGERKEVD